MLTCREVAHHHASDYLDGQLGWRMRMGMRLHLMLCDNCRRFVAQLRKVPVLLRNPPRNQVPLDPAAEDFALKLAAVYEIQKKSPPL